MTNKDWKRHMAYEALVILGLLALLTFISVSYTHLTLPTNSRV